MSLRVALLGGRGAFSEEAAEKLVGTGWTAVPGLSFDEVAASVESGAAELGVLPLENSIAGAVEDSLEAWRAHRLIAFAEHTLSVQQCLLALPGVRLEEVTHVWSHPHALAQCTPFLRAHGIHPLPSHSTGAGAERVQRDQLRHQGALGSERSAARWGLIVLATNVQAAATNFTRFVAVARDVRKAPSGSDRTALAVEARGGDAGLPIFLAELEKHGIGLLRLLGRPLPARPWRQIFHLEVAGHAMEGALKAAWARLEGVSETLQWLGSYSR